MWRMEVTFVEDLTILLLLRKQTKKPNTTLHLQSSPHIESIALDQYVSVLVDLVRDCYAVGYNRAEEEKHCQLFISRHYSLQSIEGMWFSSGGSGLGFGFVLTYTIS